MIGIDVSSYQGRINFNAVKQAGYDFVIIRAGWGKSNRDPAFDYNIEAALKAGLKVGVYWFIYAKDIDHLKHNIAMANGILNNYRDKLEMGVWADWEYDSDKYRPNLTKEERTLWVKTFIEGMISYGYKCGLYANPDYINNKFNYKVDNKPSLWKYPLWLAYYDVKEDKAKAFNPQIWQKSSKGRVNGINGYVDINVFYGEVNNEKPIEKPVEKPQIDNTEYAIVNTKKDPLYVRSGPGQKYKILTSIPKGAKVIVEDKSNKTWWKVRYNNVVGFSSKTYLKEV